MIKNNFAYVIVHGFGGHPSDTYGIKRELIKSGVDENNIHTPTLKGHKEGCDCFDFNVKYEEMINELEGYILNVKKESQKIVCIGYSMGALVVMGIVLKNKILIDKLVVINMPISVWHFKNFTYWLASDIKKKSIYHLKTVLSTFKYGRLRNSVEFLSLEKYINTNIQNISTDIFIAQSKLDYIAKPISGEYILNNVSSKNKTLVRYEKSSHFIAEEPEIEKAVEDIVKWLKLK